MQRDTIIIWAVCLVVGFGLGFLLAQLLAISALIFVGGILGVAAAFFMVGLVRAQSGG